MTNILGTEINGYRCYYANPITKEYLFSKKEGSRYLEIRCKERHLLNGDIQFMTENDLSYTKNN